MAAGRLEGNPGPATPTPVDGVPLPGGAGRSLPPAGGRRCGGPRGAAGRFLERYPSSERRQEIRWIEATLARDRLKDCERALPAYRELADNITPRLAEALFCQGICAVDLGLDAEARDTLIQALDIGLDPDRAGVANGILSKQ